MEEKELITFQDLYFKEDLSENDVTWIKEFLSQNSTRKEFFNEIQSIGILSLNDIYQKIGLTVDLRKTKKGDIIVKETLGDREFIEVDEYKDNYIYPSKIWRLDGYLYFDKNEDSEDIVTFMNFKVNEISLLTPGTFFRTIQESELQYLKAEFYDNSKKNSEMEELKKKIAEKFINKKNLKNE